MPKTFYDNDGNTLGVFYTKAEADTLLNGKVLYKHNIGISYNEDNNYINITILNNSATPINTFQLLKDNISKLVSPFLYSNTKSGIDRLFVTYGFESTTNVLTFAGYYININDADIDEGFDAISSSDTITITDDFAQLA